MYNIIIHVSAVSDSSVEVCLMSDGFVRWSPDSVGIKRNDIGIRRSVSRSDRRFVTERVARDTRSICVSKMTGQQPHISVGLWSPASVYSCDALVAEDGDEHGC